MKKTAIALAVAAIAAAPLAAQADAGAYASVRAALTNVDKGDGADATWDVVDAYSRFGFKGSEDLGNGMSAFGRWEFRVAADTATNNNGGLGYVGLKGGFGSVSIGRQWSPWYGMVGGTIDQFNRTGVAFQDMTTRLSDAVAYANTFGSVSFAAAVVADANDDDFPQATQVGVKVPAGPVTIGVALHSQTDNATTAADEEGSMTGVGVTWNGGDVTVAGTMVISSDSLSDGGAAEDETDMGIYAGFNLGGGQKVHGSFETTDAGGDATPTALTVGYQKSLSKSSRVWAEYMTVDLDDGTDADSTLSLGMRKDW